MDDAMTAPPTRPIERYRRDGYIVVEGLLDDVTRQRMKQVLAELIERARGVATHDDVYDLEPTHSPASRACAASRSRTSCIRCSPSSCARRGCSRCCRRCSARAACGCMARKLNLKAPEYGSPVEWHQDWAFYPHTNDDLLAVGVLLDDATDAERSAARAARQPSRADLRPPRPRRPLLRRDRSGARSPSTSAPPRRSTRAGGLLLVPSRAGRARLGREPLDAVAQPAAVRVRGGRRVSAARRRRLGRVQPPPAGRRRRPSCRAPWRARSACRCRRRRTRARSTRTRRRSNAATSTSRRARRAPSLT